MAPFLDLSRLSFEIWKAPRHLLDVRLALFFGPLAHAPSDVGLDQGTTAPWRWRDGGSKNKNNLLLPEHEQEVKGCFLSIPQSQIGSLLHRREWSLIVEFFRLTI